MSKQRQALERANLLCKWIEESPHTRGTINGLAAQVLHEITVALAEPEQELVMHQYYDKRGEEWRNLDDSEKSRMIKESGFFPIRALYTSLREWQAAEASREPEPETHCKYGNVRAQCQQSPMDCQCCQDAIQDIDHAAHSEPEQWQPIETAPKDQTDILTFSKEGKIDVGYWENELWCDGDYSYWEATHWMPLPTPPSELEKAKND